MGWIREMTGAQAKTMHRVAATVAASASSSAHHSLGFPATLVLTAQHDTLVKACGHVAFLDTLSAAAAAAPRSACAVRAHVLGSYHEPLFEQESTRRAATAAVIAWLTLPPATNRPLEARAKEGGTAQERERHLAPPDVEAWVADHAARGAVLQLAQTTARNGVSSESAVTRSTVSTNVVLVGLAVATTATAVLMVRRSRRL
jgi:hypothetical protein